MPHIHPRHLTVIPAIAFVVVSTASAAAGSRPTSAPPSQAQPRVDVPAPVEGDFIARHFAFGTGETLPELKLHYRTIGTPQRDGAGVVRNAVLILHGTGGSGSGFLSQTFGGQLFGPGQILDATRY